MSGTRTQWAQLIDRVMRLVYEQDDSYMGMSYDEAKEYIRATIGHWTIVQLDSYIRTEFPAAKGAAKPKHADGAGVVDWDSDS